jgi:uncharacterized OB-fold protein
MKRKAPYTNGLIKLDGADTGFMHFVDETDIQKLLAKPRVEAVFAEERKGYPTDIDYFKVI